MNDPGTDMIRLALACYRTPLDYRDRFAPTAPLPQGMDRLLWLANGSPAILAAAARQTDAGADELQDAARFLIQRICFVHGADHYRVLCLEPDAAPERIKEHRRLLIRLFHPDRAAGRETWTGHYASRINEAWTVLSQPLLRAAYDARWRLPPPAASSALATPGPPRPRNWECPVADRPRPRRIVSQRWVPVWTLGGSALVAALVVAGFYLRYPAGSVAVPPVVPGHAERAALPVGRSAGVALPTAPDGWSLEQRERTPRQADPASDDRDRLENARQELLRIEEARAERARLEEQLKAERARAERARLEEQLKAERARAERARLEEQLKAERARAERARAERARLEAAANRASPASPVAAAVATPAGRDLTTADLNSLMGRYTRAYEQGDLNGVMVLFATGARGRVHREYAALFATHHIRGLWLRDLRWFPRGESASGSGRYELLLQRRSDGQSHQVKGSIRFTVQKRDSQVLIEAIDYDWPES